MTFSTTFSHSLSTRTAKRHGQCWWGYACRSQIHEDAATMLRRNLANMSGRSFPQCCNEAKPFLRYNNRKRRAGTAPAPSSISAA